MGKGRNVQARVFTRQDEIQDAETVSVGVHNLVGRLCKQHQHDEQDEREARSVR